MEDIIELLVELFWDGALALSTDNRLPKWVRYPAIGLIVLLFSAVVGLILALVIHLLGDIWYVGVILIALDALFVFWAIRKFRRVYILKRDKWN